MSHSVGGHYSRQSFNKNFQRRRGPSAKDLKGRRVNKQIASNHAKKEKRLARMRDKLEKRDMVTEIDIFANTVLFLNVAVLLK